MRQDSQKMRLGRGTKFRALTLLSLFAARTLRVEGSTLNTERIMQSLPIIIGRLQTINWRWQTPNEAGATLIIKSISPLPLPIPQPFLGTWPDHQQLLRRQIGGRRQTSGARPDNFTPMEKLSDCVRETSNAYVKRDLLRDSIAGYAQIPDSRSLIGRRGPHAALESVRETVNHGRTGHVTDEAVDQDVVESTQLLQAYLIWKAAQVGDDVEHLWNVDRDGGSDEGRNATPIAAFYNPDSPLTAFEKFTLHHAIKFFARDFLDDMVLVVNCWTRVKNKHGRFSICEDYVQCVEDASYDEPPRPPRPEPPRPTAGGPDGGQKRSASVDPDVVRQVRRRKAQRLSRDDPHGATQAGRLHPDGVDSPSWPRPEPPGHGMEVADGPDGGQERATADSSVRRGKWRRISTDDPHSIRGDGSP